jgi:predicted Fe-S protein YdhL (DUF1289 family)
VTSIQRVESPCVGVCRLDDDGYLCVGCYRTRDEIASWARSENAVKRAVLERAKARRMQDEGN